MLLDWPPGLLLSDLPSDSPSDLPSDLLTDLTSDLPSDLLLSGLLLSGWPPGLLLSGLPLDLWSFQVPQASSSLSGLLLDLRASSSMSC